MKNLIRCPIPVLLFLSLSQSYCQMAILSGPEKGSYNRFASDIVNVLGEKQGMNLKNQTSEGSAYNFKMLTNPKSEYKIALIQSDYLNRMEAEDKLNNTHKTDSIKVVMQLATEEIHLIAKKSSGLSNLQHLDKKKVGIGNEDQGSYATGTIIKERSKVKWETYQVDFDLLLKKLADGSIDAGLIVGSAPVEMIDIDPQVMIDGISMLELDDFNGWAKYYENDTVYRNEYKWLEKDIPTFGVRTLLIVNESKLTDEDKQTVASIKSGIIKNLDQLRKQGHPKWKTVIIPDDQPIEEIEKVAVVAKTPEPVTVKAPVTVPVATQVTTDSKETLIYRVQIYSRNYKKDDIQINVNGKNYTTYVYSYLGAYRYTIGEFTSHSDALELQNKSRKSGYSQAFVATFKNNVRFIVPTQ